jgi:hypothetical protein
MSEPEQEFYSEERWENWLDRLREEELDPDDEDSARLLWNLQDDVAIAVAKVLTSYDDGDIDRERAAEELTDIREIVLDDPGLEDEAAAMLVDNAQTALACALYAAEQYVADGVADEADAEGYVRAAAEAEAEEEFDRALGLMACAGTRVIDGEQLDVGLAEDVEYGVVIAWLNGLDSLQSALEDPEVIEEEG